MSDDIYEVLNMVVDRVLGNKPEDAEASPEEMAKEVKSIVYAAALDFGMSVAGAMDMAVMYHDAYLHEFL